MSLEENSLIHKNYRYIEKGHNEDSLSDHEIEELTIDYDFRLNGYYVVAPLTKKEWNIILNSRKQ